MPTGSDSRVNAIRQSTDLETAKERAMSADNEKKSEEEPERRSVSGPPPIRPAPETSPTKQRMTLPEADMPVEDPDFEKRGLDNFLSTHGIKKPNKKK
jgi:hypothetical protein